MTGLTGTGVANTRTVEGFLNALQDADYEAAEAALDDNPVYENVGLPTIRGRAGAIKLFRRMEGRAALDCGLCDCGRGVFEVHNGRITLWRDYFDFFDMFKATLRGLAALVVPRSRLRFSGSSAEGRR